MSAAPVITRPPGRPGDAGGLAPGPRAVAPAVARQLAARLRNEWLPRAAWAIGRTGRTGMLGVALLLAAALFLVSTHLPVVAEVESLRADLSAAQSSGRAPASEQAADPAGALPALPARTDVPAMLRQLFSTAAQAQLAVDTGKYDIKEARSGGVVRYHIAFPVTGPYPHIRAFVDSTLAGMPAVALSDLALERKTIADGEVEAQLRLTIYTSAAAAPGGGPGVAGPREGPAPDAPGGSRGSDRVVEPAHAAALFAPHSWVVLKPVRLPPPPPAAPPPAPPDPTAPPFPYALVGSYAPLGEPPVFYLSHGDRMIEARVGDRLDGVYQFESAAGDQLVFVYLPLNIRQNISAGASK